MNIRPARPGDVPSLQTIADATELFPGEMLPDMIAPFFGDEAAPELWLSAEADGVVVGFCYTVPEQLADGAWNMLAIAVSPDLQGQGVGGTLCEKLEAELRKQGARILLADTSGTPDFARTRQFYATHGYEEEARIRDFWAAGDDKVTFRKAL